MEQELKDYIERLRIKLRLNNQADVSRVSGFSKVTLSTFANKHRIPSVSTLLIIAAAIDKIENNNN